MLRFLLTRLAAAVVLTAAAGLAVPAPASAAACPTATGVTVVVDFDGLGGGLQVLCDASGGGDTAASLFTSNGYPLTYAQRQPGYVCRVSGVPTSDPCVNTSPANAYWGLWWSDGESGAWAYASLGASSLRIPDGGYVAFAWDQVDGQAQPGATPAAHAAEPTPTPTQSTPSAPSPSHSGGGQGTPSGSPGANQGGGSDPTSTPTSGAPSPSDSPSEDATSSPSGKPTRTPSGAESSSAAAAPSDPTSAPAPATDETVEPAEGGPATADDGGVPVWLTPVLIGLIFVAAGATVWHRRRVPSSR